MRLVSNKLDTDVNKSGMLITYQIARDHRQRVKMGLLDVKPVVILCLPQGFQVAHSEHGLDPEALSTAQQSPHCRRQTQIRSCCLAFDAMALHIFSGHLLTQKVATNLHRSLHKTHLSNLEKSPIISCLKECNFSTSDLGPTFLGMI